MLFTKIWTAILAVLATACLAGMYLLSTGASGGFTKADEAAVRAITEAGMAALASDINSSPVSLGPSVLADARLKEALDKSAVPPEGASPDEQSLQDVFTQVINENLLNEYPLMSMAIVDKSGNILARSGFDAPLFDELMKVSAVETALGSEEAERLSATLGGKLHAVQVSRPVGESQQRRLLTIRAVELGGGSFFRRVVGTENPAGLVRAGEVLGDPIGGAKAGDLTAWVEGNLDSVPPEGASQVFQIGTGPDARIGSAARVPGPAGKGKDGTLFVVLSSHTLGSTQQDMSTALSAALASGGLSRLNWILVGGLLVISLALTFYLPFIEYSTPLRRLAAEYRAIAEAKQHEVNHDTYSGEVAKVALGSQRAMEALHLSWENEAMEGEEDPEPSASGSLQRRTRGTRNLRSKGRHTRGHKKLDDSGTPRSAEDDPEAIELPGMKSKAPIERHASAEDKPKPPPAPVSAPTFSDAVADGPAVALSDDDDSVSLGLDVGMDAGGGGEGDRESYYKRIYDEFVETKSACGEDVENFSYEKFAKKLRKQSDSLLARADVKDVEFSVYVKDGKAALRAKVVKA
ncbi:hypothetical protein G6O69_16950 [Pseudenhygromyxa sp. WMMC2535]|uniref:MXAN_5187 C-terminal domain-containing protein n=1 Tax=Pseudenhygromyxa sp. WMMC2535 TaxID=2712867 RepID=UPI001552BE9A|nr:MXAN_5187 C-terminal domain-containing protein [Pseudenhygromyxa sp. WMMC2535]NVB39533.1 hypothetical protein [Pseudenhygromyxa sp. WMMC2535]